MIIELLSKKYGKHKVIVDDNFNVDIKLSVVFKKDVPYVACYDKVLKKSVLLHRYIMKYPLNKMVDHINHNTLDNRQENLRECTNSQNQANAKLRKDNISGYKGVVIENDRGRKRIRAKIVVKGKIIRLGDYRDVESAYSAYKKAACKYFGEYSNLPT